MEWNPFVVKIIEWFGSKLESVKWNDKKIFCKKCERTFEPPIAGGVIEEHRKTCGGDVESQKSHQSLKFEK